MAAIASPTNPATRLHAILTQATARRGSNNPAYQIWAGIFDVPDDPLDQVLIRCGQLVSLIVEVRRLGDALPASENPEIVMRHYGEVEQVGRSLGAVAGTAYTASIQQLKDTGLLSVELLAASLKRQGYREADVSTDHRTAFLSELAALKAEVSGSNELDDVTRRRILQALEEAEAALKESLLRGGDGLQAASDGLVGLLVNLPRRTWSSPAVRKVAKWTAGLAGAIIVATVSDVASHAIEGGSTPAQSPGVEVVLMIANGGDTPPALHDGSVVKVQVDGEVVDAEVVHVGETGEEPHGSAH